MTSNPVLLDPVIHAPNRLQICAMLIDVARVEFRALREELSVSDSVLSKHLKQLETAKYVEQKKEIVSGRSRTWVSVTEVGQKAFREYVKQLNRLVNLGESSSKED